MIDFDQLVETLQSHLGMSGDALNSALLAMDSDHLAVLTQYLDGDELIRMLESAGVEAETVPPDDLRMTLEALAEAVSEVLEEKVDVEPAKPQGGA
ncbi:MAG TPA: hypothetical protein VEX87_17420 [Skermanella sp.]|jgi:formamidopyrimidine-DNA glycosylase|nr:hypothetical protein [Skermanella sp.]